MKKLATLCAFVSVFEGEGVKSPCACSDVSVDAQRWQACMFNVLTQTSEAKAK